MKPYFLLITVLLPLVSGGLLCIPRRKSDRWVKCVTMAVTLLTSALVWGLILTCGRSTFMVLQFAQGLTLEFRLDGLGRFFAGIVATLWPLTVLYAFSYMAKDTRNRTFFSFFTMAYGATLGVTMASNLFTLYCFYELLTLTTVPLVIHPLNRKAVRAARTYFIFSIGGAAFAFAALTFLIANSFTGSFVLGGFFTQYPYGKPYIALIFYVLGFFGFGVKAAVFPLHIWLPKASVAPTPVTALLHAVAVVKSGVFAIIRLTYYCFGPSVLKGTWAQTLVMGFAVFTILYGVCRAVKESHWKRRLAYSTVANLSYILFGVTLMTQAGMAAGLLHMAFHAEIKILGFFCVGAVMHNTGREYIYQLNGLGRKMPVTFACFTIAALALMGLPPLSGFVSKWYLLAAAAEEGTWMAYVGFAVLLIAAFMTACYMLTAVRRAWFPAKGSCDRELSLVHEADGKMTAPMVILAVGIVLTGVFAQPIADTAAEIAAGLF